MDEKLYARKEDKRSADSCLSMIVVGILGLVVVVVASLLGW
jgi:hypothetical protein